MALQNPITKMPFERTMKTRTVDPVEKPAPFRDVAKYSNFQPSVKTGTASPNPMGSLVGTKSSPADGKYLQATGASTKVNPNSIAKDLTNRKKTTMGSEDLNQRSGSAGQIPNRPVVATNSFPMRPKSLRKPESLA